jgi:hypothetical protein
VYVIYHADEIVMNLEIVWVLLCSPLRSKHFRFDHLKRDFLPSGTLSSKINKIKAG